MPMTKQEATKRMRECRKAAAKLRRALTKKLADVETLDTRAATHTQACLIEAQAIVMRWAYEIEGAAYWQARADGFLAVHLEGKRGRK